MSNETDSNITYTAALQRLRVIVDTLQSPDCNINDMVALTREAASLIAHCRSRLTTTQAELEKVLADLDTQA